MNKFILSLTVSLLLLTTGYAQNLLEKVPSNASMVIKYSGENFSKNLPLKKLESYPFIKDNLFKMLKVDSLTTLENTGIDLQQDIYQYMVTEDSTINYVTLLHLNNVSQFLKLADAQSIPELKPEKKNGYEWLAVNADTYLGWNNQWAIIVLSHYENPNRFNYYNNYSDQVSADTTSAVSTDSLQLILDSVMAKVKADTEELSKSPKKKEVKKPGMKKAKVPAATKGVHKKSSSTAKKQKSPAKKPEIVEEVIMDTSTVDKAYDEEITGNDAPKDSYTDTTGDAERLAYSQGQENITKARQKKVAGDIIDNSFNKLVNSIENDISYKKIIDPAAHISGWFNYQDLMQQYWSFFYRGFMGYRGSGMAGMQQNYNNDTAAKVAGDIPANNKKESLGVSTSMNVYFDKDKMRIEQKTYTGEGEMANLSKDIFNSKQSQDLVKLVNPDNIGYLSASINTEAMSKYYYKWIKQYLGNNAYMGEYADLADVYIDLLEIIIDEKAISDLVPGNYLFVLHDMKTKKVSYTDYIYDDNFKSTEVQKTKQELSPNFTFAMETRNESFMKKVAALPLKYARKGDYNYQDRGGYYELIFDSGKNVLNSLYFMVKDGKVIVTTSKKSIDIALNNTGAYNLDDETKKSILKNNYSFKLNTKWLIQQLGPELTSGVNKQISSYLMENIGDFKMESSLKNDMIQGTTTMAISGNHTNSLEFFFNVIDNINDIIKKDREEREQKLN